MISDILPFDPEEVATEAIGIYEKLYQAGYEKGHKGEYVAIDVVSEQAYLGIRPEEALTKAKNAKSDGKFFLIKVGANTAFNAGPLCEYSGRLVGCAA